MHVYLLVSMRLLWKRTQNRAIRPSSCFVLTIVHYLCTLYFVEGFLFGFSVLVSVLFCFWKKRIYFALTVPIVSRDPILPRPPPLLYIIRKNASQDLATPLPPLPPSPITSQFFETIKRLPGRLRFDISQLSTVIYYRFRSFLDRPLSRLAHL